MVVDVEPAEGAARDPRAERARAALVAVCGLTSVAAVGGTVQLVTGWYAPPVAMLEPLGLGSWALPGVWLFATVAVPCGVAAVSAWRRSRDAGARAVAAAALLALELVVQIPIVGPDVLQLVMGLAAGAMLLWGRALQRAGRPRTTRVIIARGRR